MSTVEGAGVEAGAEEQQPPRAHVRVVYLGPVAPHWEVQSDYGDRELVEEFRQRTLARLVLLPPHDPQYRRNRERVVRDAERENIVLEWDLGVPSVPDDLAAAGEDSDVPDAPAAEVTGAAAEGAAGS